MEEVKQGRLTETVHGLIFRGPLARFSSPDQQVLPPLLALIFEFAAFASIPLLFMLYLLLLSPRSSGTVPTDLYGVWKTSAPKYADRYMDISEGVILFGTGGDTLESYVIDKVEVQPNGTKALYTITYLDADNEELQLSFYYESGDRRVMTFKHQDHLKWTPVQE